jgi:hypothetical protein
MTKHCKRLLWQVEIDLPYKATVALGTLDAEPAHVVIELIDPTTGRVKQRYRPVSAAQNVN